MSRTRGTRGRRRPRLRFDGWIAGMGTSSGTRVVLGHWPGSPFGPFSDVMIERPDGERLLLAPSGRTADFVSGTYTFDTVHVVPVDVSVAEDTWTVTAGPLSLRFGIGRRGVPGRLLRAVPGALTARPAWSALTYWPARLLLPGVRTRGSAGAGRREWYGVHDLRPVTAMAAVFEGHDLGAMAPVEPPVRFGFGSVPARPTLTRVTTTVELGGPSPSFPAGPPGYPATLRTAAKGRPMGKARAPERADVIAVAHGTFNLVGGLWPLAHLRSFEWVFGPKRDVWLQMTTGGLLVSAGIAQLAAAPAPQGVVHARRIGLGTALTLLAVDLIYVPKGRIRPTYLLDAAMQTGWITAWLRASPMPADAKARSGG